MRIDRAAWIDEQLTSLDARTTVRAAQALGRLGGDEAERALREALTRPLRADVQGVVRQSLDDGARVRRSP